MCREGVGRLRTEERDPPPTMLMEMADGNPDGWFIGEQRDWQEMAAPWLSHTPDGWLKVSRGTGRMQQLKW